MAPGAVASYDPPFRRWRMAASQERIPRCSHSRFPEPQAWKGAVAPLTSLPTAAGGRDRHRVFAIRSVQDLRDAPSIVSPATRGDS